MCGVIFMILFMTRDRVEQDVMVGVDGGTKFATFVWHDTKIVKAWFVDIDKLTDSIKVHHKEAGEALLKTINK